MARIELCNLKKSFGAVLADLPSVFRSTSMVIAMSSCCLPSPSGQGLSTFNAMLVSMRKKTKTRRAASGRK